MQAFVFSLLLFGCLLSVPNPPRTNLSTPLHPRMRLVEGGTFAMGQNRGARREVPRHLVKLSDFYLAETEVTNQQYCAFLNEKGNQKEENATWLALMPGGQIHMIGGTFVPWAGRENVPVVHVTWYGARAYCQWLSQKTGESYRLPTEAEWEYAAGGGNGKRTRWSGTNRKKKLTAYAQFEEPASQARYPKLHPVAQLLPNQLGLYDMTGNAAEWCRDRFYSTTYRYDHSRGIVENPSGLENPFWLAFERVHRGGGVWNRTPALLRITRRSYSNPDDSYATLGFRPAKTP